jgi:hypothetical protein
MKKQKSLMHNLSFFLAEFRGTGTLWVSGTNAGKGCDNTYGWCGSKKLFYDNFTWNQNEPSLPYDERCVAINWVHTTGAGGLVDSKCSQTRNFICEVFACGVLIVENQLLFTSLTGRSCRMLTQMSCV